MLVNGYGQNDIREVGEAMTGREIKFRAWDAKNKEMLYRSEVDISVRCDGLLSGAVYEESDDCILSTREIPLMQYTGVKDRNGTDIYEGDIIIEKWRRAKQNRLVTYRKAMFGTVDDTQNAYTFISLYNDLYHDEIEQEVIGNIYENPELLSEAKNE